MSSCDSGAPDMERAVETGRTTPNLARFFLTILLFVSVPFAMGTVLDRINIAASRRSSLASPGAGHRRGSISEAAVGGGQGRQSADCGEEKSDGENLGSHARHLRETFTLRGSGLKPGETGLYQLW